MSIYSIDDLRSAAQGAGITGSDEFLITDYAKRVGQDPFKVAEQLGVRTGKDRGALAAGFSSGIDDLQGLGYSAGAAVANTLGATRAQNWLNNRADQNQAESQLNGRPDLERVEDVWDHPSKWLPYAGYQVAKQIPNIIGGIGAGLLVPEAAVPAALTRLAAAGPRMLGLGGMAGRVAAATAEGSSVTAAKLAAEKAGQTFANQIVGGGAWNYGQSVGSLYQASVEGGDADAGLKSLVGGVPYALAETLPEAMMVGRLGHGTGFKGNLLTRMGKAGALQAGTGATSELLQGEMEMAYNGHVTPEQAASNRLNSGVAGGLVEGLMGSLGGFRKHTRLSSGGIDLIAQTDQPDAYRDALYNPNTDPVTRGKARDAIVAEAAKQGVGPEHIDAWLNARYAEDDAQGAQAGNIEIEGGNRVAALRSTVAAGQAKNDEAAQKIITAGREENYAAAQQGAAAKTDAQRLGGLTTPGMTQSQQAPQATAPTGEGAMAVQAATQQQAPAPVPLTPEQQAAEQETQELRAGVEGAQAEAAAKTARAKSVNLSGKRAEDLLAELDTRRANGELTKEEHFEAVKALGYKGGPAEVQNMLKEKFGTPDVSKKAEKMNTSGQPVQETPKTAQVATPAPVTAKGLPDAAQPANPGKTSAPAPVEKAAPVTAPAPAASAGKVESVRTEVTATGETKRVVRVAGDAPVAPVTGRGDYQSRNAGAGEATAKLKEERKKLVTTAAGASAAQIQKESQDARKANAVASGELEAELEALGKPPTDAALLAGYEARRAPLIVRKGELKLERDELSAQLAARKADKAKTAEPDDEGLDPASPEGRRVAAIDIEIARLLPPIDDIRAQVADILSPEYLIRDAADAKERADRLKLQTRLSALTGMELTKDGQLVQRNSPRTMQDVASDVGLSAKGVATTKQNISQQLDRVGLSDLHLGRLYAGELASTTASAEDTVDGDGASSDSNSDLVAGSAPSEGPVNTGMRVAGTVAKVAGQGLIRAEPFKAADLARISKMVAEITKAGFTPESIAETLAPIQEVIDAGDGKNKVSDEDTNTAAAQASRVKSEVLDRVSRAKLKAETGSSVAGTAPTAQDLAYAERRLALAKTANLARLAAFYNSGAGREAVRDWDAYRDDATPAFANLLEKDQLAWLEAVSTLEESELDAPGYLERLVRDLESTINPDLPAGLAAQEADVGRGQAGAGNNTQADGGVGSSAAQEVANPAAAALAAIDAIEGLNARTKAKFKYFKGNLAEMTTDEVRETVKIAEQLNNDALKKKANAELEKRKGEPRRVRAATIEDDSRTIDGTDLVRVVTDAEMKLMGDRVASLPPGVRGLLASTYGEQAGTPEFAAKLREDLVNFANKAVEKIDAAIRGIISAVAQGVLAAGIIFNPGAFTKGLDINLPRTVSVWTTAQTQVGVTAHSEVPGNAKAKMSTLAQQVYSSMAPVAAKTGKGFMIADKPNGMLHVFKADGSMLVQDAALYGKDAGDVVKGLGSMRGGAKITEAGKFMLKATPDHEYEGGMVFKLVESEKNGQFTAVHAAWMGDAAENRGARLKSPTAADNKISFACINTAHETFLKQLLPNAAMLGGGLIFVLPDAQENTAAMFPAQTETRTSESTTVASAEQRDDGAKAGASRTTVGKEEKVQFSQGDTAQSSTVAQVTAEVKEMMPVSQRLVVVDQLTDLPANVQAAVAQQSTDGKAVRGFVMGGRAYLIASNIEPGTARAVFMHEVGAHLGLDNQLSAEQHLELANKVREWASKADGSVESKLAQKALARVAQAGTDAADQNSELIAYFTEEAVKSGIDPTAMQYKGAMARWFRSMWGAFKAALRKMGINADKFTAQDVVDMAYGAAKLEMAADQKAAAAERIKFSVGPQVSQAAERVMGASGGILANNAAYGVKKLVNSLAFLHDLVDEHASKMPAVKDWYKAVQATITTRNLLIAEAETIAVASDKLKGGAGNVNEFLSRSTFEQKWGYDPKIAGKVTNVDGAMRAKFNALTPEEQAVVKSVFGHGEKMRGIEQALLKKLGIEGLLKGGTGKLDGPYAPLKRFGDFVAVLKSAELVKAENAKDDKLAEKLKADPAHYVVSYFDSIGLAKQFAKANDAAYGGKYEMAAPFAKSERTDKDKQIPPEVLNKVLAAVSVNKALTPQARDAMVKMVGDMYLQSVDEHNARTSGVRRLNRAGYDADMMRSFLSHARARAGFLANMEHGREMNTAFYEMQQQGRGIGAGGWKNQDVFNTFAAHYAANLDYKETPIQDGIMAFTSAFQLATSVGYHVANAMQGLMVTLPKLAADFNNYGGAWKHLMDGYGTVKQTGMWGKVDLSKVKSPGLRAVLQEAADLNILDIGNDGDVSHFEASHTGVKTLDGASKVVRKALSGLSLVSKGVESANRIASASAAYNMALAHGKTAEQAHEYALNVLRTTQGDMSRTGAPLLLKKLPKVMTQYRKYQFMMAALYVKAFRDTFHGVNLSASGISKDNAVEAKAVRAIGRRMLAYKLGHTVMAAGVLGMPLMNLVAMVFAGLGGGDDEPADLERTMREAGIPDFMLHGPLSYLGLDMSAKLGEEKVFSLMPTTDFDISSKKGLASTVMGLMGPTASQLGNMADGIGAMQKGDYDKGIEKLMPKGIANMMKAFRISNEGYTLKNGDVMYKPEDVNGFALALDALGMPSTALRRMDWMRGQQYEIGQFFKGRTTEIEQRYSDAVKAGDNEAKADLRQQWMDLQSGKDRQRQYFGDSHDSLKRQSLSDLLKHPQVVAKREKKLQKSAPVE